VVSFEIETPIDPLVIPAKAGIQSVVVAFPIACGMDSRLRGNDGTGERPRIANDTTTRRPKTFCPALSETHHNPLDI